jgi:hypothetical protein
MSRRELVRRLRAHGCVLHHHGGRHDVWMSLRALARAPVPLYAEPKCGTVIGIRRILGALRPRGL